jgi:hypothetical protein
MGATALDAKLFQFAANPPAASAAFNLKGGTYLFGAIFTSLVTAIELQMLGPDGSTFISVGTAGSPTMKVSATNGSAVGQLPPGQYKFVLTGGGSTGTAFMSVTGIPT